MSGDHAQTCTGRSMFFTSCLPRSTKSMPMRPRTCSCTRVGDRDAARLRQPFEARGDVDAVAVEVVALDHHVAEIDADAEHDAARPRARRHWRRPWPAAARRRIRRRSRRCRTRRAWPSPSSLKMRPWWRSDQRVQHVPAPRLQRGERARLVALHQAAVADHVGREDGGEPALNALFGHVKPVVGRPRDVDAPSGLLVSRRLQVHRAGFTARKGLRPQPEARNWNDRPQPAAKALATLSKAGEKNRLRRPHPSFATCRRATAPSAAFPWQAPGASRCRRLSSNR